MTQTTTNPEDVKLPPLTSLAYGAQHVLAMYGGIIAPPIIIGTAAGFSVIQIAGVLTASLLISGIATIFQTLRIGPFGSGLPVVQGVSFTGVSTMAVIASDNGIQALYGAIIVAAIVGFLVTPLMGRIFHLFPPVVSGSIILVVGLSLFPVAFNWIIDGTGGETHASMKNIALAFFTFIVIIALNKFSSGLIARLSILLGLLVGTLAAIPFGMVDFGSVGGGSIVALPDIFPGGGPVFHLGVIFTLTIVVIVNMVETATAGIIAVGEVIGTDVSSERISGGLRVDMLATGIGPIFGVMPLSVFAQNVGVVAVTKIHSRFVVAYGGGILVVLGLLPIAGRVVASVPSPVLGGAGLVLFGMVASSGIGLLSKVDLNDTRSMLIVSSSVSVGLIPEMVPGFWAGAPDWIAPTLASGICLTTVVAFIMNLVFSKNVRTVKAPAPYIRHVTQPGHPGKETAEVNLGYESGAQGEALDDDEHRVVESHIES